jgi:hypothetical protein
MPTRQQDLTLARWHLAAAQQLLRRALALRILVAVNRAIKLTDALLAQGAPGQPLLELEARDDGAAV